MGKSWDFHTTILFLSAPVQTGPGAYPVSCTMGTGSFPGVKRSRGVTLTPHPLLVSWSRKGSAVPLLPLWAVRLIQSLSSCTRVYFTLPQCLYEGALTLPQCLYKGALYLFYFTLFLTISLSVCLSVCLSVSVCLSLFHVLNNWPVVMKFALIFKPSKDSATHIRWLIQ